MGGFNVYAMIGIGLSNNRINDLTRFEPGILPRPGTGSTVTRFAWNAGFGIQYQATRALIFEVGYRYMDAGHYLTIANNAPAMTSRLTSHQAMFTVVVPFAGLGRRNSN